MSFRTTTSPVDRQGNVFSYPPLGGYFFFPREKNRFFRFFPHRERREIPVFFSRETEGNVRFFLSRGKEKFSLFSLTSCRLPPRQSKSRHALSTGS